MRCQHSALRIASTVLDLNVLNVADVFDGVAAGAQRELEKQATLIASVDADLEMASRVQIHRESMSSAVQWAMDAGSRARNLGDYVSAEKMRRVAETCRRMHGSSIFPSFFERGSCLHVGTDDLRERFHNIGANMKRLSDGAAETRLSFSDTRYVRAVFLVCCRCQCPPYRFRWLQKALLSRRFPLRPAFLQGPGQSASLPPPVRLQQRIKFVPTLLQRLTPLRLPSFW